MTDPLDRTGTGPQPPQADDDAGSPVGAGSPRPSPETLDGLPSGGVDDPGRQGDQFVRDGDETPTYETFRGRLDAYGQSALDIYEARIGKPLDPSVISRLTYRYFEDRKHFVVRALKVATEYKNKSLQITERPHGRTVQRTVTLTGELIGVGRYSVIIKGSITGDSGETSVAVKIPIFKKQPRFASREHIAALQQLSDDQIVNFNYYGTETASLPGYLFTDIPLLGLKSKKLPVIVTNYASGELVKFLGESDLEQFSADDRKKILDRVMYDLARFTRAGYEFIRHGEYYDLQFILDGDLNVQWIDLDNLKKGTPPPTDIAWTYQFQEYLQDLRINPKHWKTAREAVEEFERQGAPSSGSAPADTTPRKAAPATKGSGSKGDRPSSAKATAGKPVALTGNAGLQTHALSPSAPIATVPLGTTLADVDAVLAEPWRHPTPMHLASTPSAPPPAGETPLARRRSSGGPPSDDPPSVFGKLKIVTEVPDALKTTNVHEAISNLEGPTAVHLNYSRETTRVVSVLVHGNEPSGFAAMLKYLNEPHEDPPTNIIFLIQNVRAAKAGEHFQYRHLDDQPDLNKAWTSLNDPDSSADSYVTEVRQFLQEIHKRSPIEAIVDLHNTSGLTPSFAVVTGTEGDSKHIVRRTRLASILASRTITLRKGEAFDTAVNAIAPTVTFECGKGDREDSTHVASRTLNTFFNNPPGFLEVERVLSPIFDHIATVTLTRNDIPMAVAESPPVAGALRLNPRIEYLSFQVSRPDAWIAEWDGEDMPIQARDTAGNDITGEYFELRDGKIYLKNPTMTAMATLDLENIRKSELFHIVKYQLPDFLNEDELRATIQSADGKVTVGEITPRATGLPVTTIVLQLLYEGEREIGTFTISYTPDFETSGKYVQAGADIAITENGSYYGVELYAQRTRLNYKNPHITNMYTMALREGRFVWRHFDGLQLSTDSLLQIRTHLLGWNTRFDLGIDSDKIYSATTPYQLVHLADIGEDKVRRLQEALSGDISRAYHASSLSADQINERIRFPGELALLLATKVTDEGVVSEIPAYTGHMDTTPGSPQYAAWLDSVIEYWEARREKVDRAGQILESLRAERESIRYEVAERSLRSIFEPDRFNAALAKVPEKLATSGTGDYNRFTSSFGRNYGILSDIASKRRDDVKDVAVFGAGFGRDEASLPREVFEPFEQATLFPNATVTVYDDEPMVHEFLGRKEELSLHVQDETMLNVEQFLQYLKTYFGITKDALVEGGYKLKIPASVVRRIQSQQLQFLTDPVPTDKKFDVISCFNVLYYMKVPEKDPILANAFAIQMADRLKPNGELLIDNGITPAPLTQKQAALLGLELTVEKNLVGGVTSLSSSQFYYRYKKIGDGTPLLRELAEEARRLLTAAKTTAQGPGAATDNSPRQAAPATKNCRGAACRAQTGSTATQTVAVDPTAVFPPGTTLASVNTVLTEPWIHPTPMHLMADSPGTPPTADPPPSPPATPPDGDPPPLLSQRPVPVEEIQITGWEPAWSAEAPPAALKLKINEGGEQVVIFERRSRDEAFELLSRQDFPDDLRKYLVMDEDPPPHLDITLARSLDGEILAYSVIAIGANDTPLTGVRAHKRIHTKNNPNELKGLFLALNAYSLRRLQNYWNDLGPDDEVIDGIKAEILIDLRMEPIGDERSPVPFDAHNNAFLRKEVPWILSRNSGFTDIPLLNVASIKSSVEEAAKALKMPEERSEWNDRRIAKRVKVIRQALAALPDYFNPLKEGNHFGEIVSDPLIDKLFIRVFSNLAEIYKQTGNHWYGIRNFGYRLANCCFQHRSELSCDLTEALLSVIGYTKTAPVYDRFFPDAEEKLGFGRSTFAIPHGESPEKIKIEPERLGNASYRNELADKLFRLSRGNPELERAILVDLNQLALGPEATAEIKRGVVLLLREFIPLSRREAFDSDDAILVKDYSDLVYSVRPLYLIDPSSLYTPDQWTRTMNAGLREILKQDRLEGKEVLEIGTGLSILSLFVSQHSDVSKIYSVDVNRMATVVAPLNILLAHSNEEGNLEDPRVLDRFQFSHTEDLFAGVPEGKKFPLIFACIPQVPATTATMTARELADHYVARGYPEDIDGLGLLAQTLEQAEEYLEEGGRVALIVSGRPGLAAIQRMANLRGWAPTSVYETVFDQERDNTNLDGYERIEKMGLRLPFEFWAEGKQITAAEANARIKEYNRKMGEPGANIAEIKSNPKYKITHKQYIVEFKPLSHLKKQFQTIAREKVATLLKKNRSVRYFNETGSEYEPFREALANLLSSMAGTVIPQETLFVAPTVENLLHNYFFAAVEKGEPIYIDPALDFKESLHRNMGRWGTTQQTTGEDHLRVYSLGESKVNLAEELADAHQQERFTVFVAGPKDGTQFHELANLLHDHPEYRDTTTIVWQNTHLPVDEAPLATMVLWNKALYDVMVVIGKDTYSRVSQQAVYEEALLSAQQNYSRFEIDFSKAPRTLGPVPGGDKTRTASRIEQLVGPVPDPEMRDARHLLAVEGDRDDDVTDLARELWAFLSHPPRLDPESGIVDMSFGESEFLIPDNHLESLIATLPEEVDESRVRSLISDYLVRTRQTEFSPNAQIQFGAGVHPLLARTLRTPEVVGDSENFTVLLPQGYYGYFPSTIHAAGGNTERFPIDPQGTDKARLLEDMEAAWKRGKAKGKPTKAILISYPTNPAGLFYSREYLEALVSFCKEKGIYILADEIFYNTGRSEAQTSIFKLMEDAKYKDFLETHLIGYSGAAKDFGFGGLRFGFMYSKNSYLLSAIHSGDLVSTDPIAMRMAKTLYHPGFYTPYFEAHLQWLEEKREAMLSLLRPYAEAGLFSFREPEGGFFLEVDVKPILEFGQRIWIRGLDYKIDSENFRKLLDHSSSVRISHVGWSGNPNTIRLVYALQNLDEGIERLRVFFEACLKAMGKPAISAEARATAETKPATAELPERPGEHQRLPHMDPGNFPVVDDHDGAKRARLFEDWTGQVVGHPATTASAGRQVTRRPSLVARDSSFVGARSPRPQTGQSLTHIYIRLIQAGEIHLKDELQAMEMELTAEQRRRLATAKGFALVATVEGILAELGDQQAEKSTGQRAKDAALRAAERARMLEAAKLLAK